MAKQKDIWAIIPARGGSKGIHKKNLQLVGGLPLVARCILTAKQAKSITRIFVSTDDQEIAQCAKRYGAEIVTRPPEISSDWASSEDALLHAIDAQQKLDSVAPWAIVMLQCTAPFTMAQDIDNCIALLQADKADSSFAAAPFKHFLWEQEKDSAIKPINHDGGFRKRRQDIAPQFLEAGSVYAMKTEIFKQEKNRFCGKTVICEIDANRCFEIDTLQELKQAQQLAPIIDRYNALSAIPTKIDAVVFDFDGVFTDNSVWVDENGKESVRCNRSDGFGLNKLRALNIPMLVISKEKNPVVKARCEKLGLSFMQGIDDKLTALKNWLDDNNLSSEKTIYMGNDVNDLPCLKYVGCAVGPNDSHKELFSELDIVLSKAGGHGAVRALCNMVTEKIN